MHDILGPASSIQQNAFEDFLGVEGYRCLELPSLPMLQEGRLLFEQQPPHSLNGISYLIDLMRIAKNRRVK